MNRCENYTLDCEAKDCCECDMFWWDGTGEEPEENEDECYESELLDIAESKE